jgi:hypothetical protein
MPQQALCICHHSSFTLQVSGVRFSFGPSTPSHMRLYSEPCLCLSCPPHPSLKHNSQVSGVRFSFDPIRPPGSRIPVSSVSVGSEAAPLDPAATYTLATKAYLAEGKDGYDVLDVSRPLFCFACRVVEQQRRLYDDWESCHWGFTSLLRGFTSLCWHWPYVRSGLV